MVEIRIGIGRLDVAGDERYVDIAVDIANPGLKPNPAQVLNLPDAAFVNEKLPISRQLARARNQAQSPIGRRRIADVPIRWLDIVVSDKGAHTRDVCALLAKY